MNRIYVVGIGPGDSGQMTSDAVSSLRDSEVIIGYTVYVELVKAQFPGKEFMTTPMRKEKERCLLAFETASAGRTVSMICSGDAGVYGMAGLILELSKAYPDTEIEIVPGITAALAGAAVLGAPLMHDFCVISLSDILTPWEKIEKRLLLSARADLVICIYNPASRKRKNHLRRACELLLQVLPPETVCGVVRNISRKGMESSVLSLSELKCYEADMFTTVFIGNSQTREADGRMITPRGYQYE